MQLKLARIEKNGEPEIFRSIQGEGVSAGRLRVFIRLAGCNLHCVWCDTAYTWNWTGTAFAHERDKSGEPHKFDPDAETMKLPVKAVAAAILAEPAEGLVITGGEPLLQMSALAALIDEVHAHAPSMAIEIETNGSIAPSDALVDRVDLFMVSPKLAHSGNPAGLALKAAALQAFGALEAAAFKFVVRTEADIETAAALARDLGIAAERVWIMPEGAGSKALMARGRALADTVAAYGFNYSDRLHIHLFGQRRGA